MAGVLARRGCSALPLGTLKRCPPRTFLWNEGSLSPTPVYAALGFSLPFSLPETEGLPASTAPGCGQWPGDPGPGIQGPGLDLRTGAGPWGPSSPHFPLLPPSTAPTLTLSAVQLRWGLSTARVGGWMAGPGLCLNPRGSLLLPPPALPEPGPCAACSPCPFVPEEGGGGRPTVPKAGHQP